jgi:hypothetical protein
MALLRGKAEGGAAYELISCSSSTTAVDRYKKSKFLFLCVNVQWRHKIGGFPVLFWHHRRCQRMDLTLAERLGYRISLLPVRPYNQSSGSMGGGAKSGWWICTN